MTFQECQIRCLMYVLWGLARHKAILGIDGAGTEFGQATELLPMDICPLFVQSEVCVAPRTIRQLTVLPKKKASLLCPAPTM